ncbi:cyclase family protein [candidate division KSB1 bacterium]|nr:cyclase family protein [candidate division KSB1 bacterium]RQW04829.1 MAG: cyclase family protein [candidate division KSB1 bacterium]
MKTASTTIIDLSHPIAENMPLWPGDPKTKIETCATVAQDGYMLNQVTIGEHTGTHIGAPRHFSATGRSVDNIPPQHLFAECAVLDVQTQARKDNDYLVQVADVVEWEKEFGMIKSDSIVLFKTGWSLRWTIPAAYWGTAPNGNHFPGVSLQTAQYLVDKRNIIGLGVDTGGIDGGQSKDFATNQLLAANDIYHLENLNLKDVKSGRLHIFVGALAIQSGSGSPCRVLALLD